MRGSFPVRLRQEWPHHSTGDRGCLWDRSHRAVLEG